MLPPTCPACPARLPLPPSTCLPCLPLQHNQTAISVREDFSDLEQQILPFLRDTPRAQVGAWAGGAGRLLTYRVVW